MCERQFLGRLIGPSLLLELLGPRRWPERQKPNASLHCKRSARDSLNEANGHTVPTFDNAVSSEIGLA